MQIDFSAPTPLAYFRSLVQSDDHFPLLEAAASGLPIVTTNTVGCQDVVENGVNGFLVPVKTVAPLAAALEALISDPELRRTMGKRGRLLVEKEFSSERVIKETLAVYSQMLQVSMLAGQAHPT